METILGVVNFNSAVNSLYVLQLFIKTTSGNNVTQVLVIVIG